MYRYQIDEGVGVPICVFAPGCRLTLERHWKVIVLQADGQERNHMKISIQTTVHFHVTTYYLINYGHK